MNAETSGTGKRKSSAKSSSATKKTTTRARAKTAAKPAAKSRAKSAAKTATKTRSATAKTAAKTAATAAENQSAATAAEAQAEQASLKLTETQTAPTPQPAAQPKTPAAAPPVPGAADVATRQSMLDLLERQRKAFLAEGKVHLGVRLDRIDRCISLLVSHHKRIVEALNQDFGGRAPQLSTMIDILDSLTQLKHTKRHVRRWMRPERRSPGLLSWLMGARASIRYQPKGVVGVMTPWNFPINMIFNPLSNLLGAGNRAMIKPSECNPATAELIAELFPRYFEPTEIAVCTGGPEVGAIFSSLPFDHLIFTGGTEIGRKVLSAAAPNLTPVTLELGGKSPVIIGKSADLRQAAERIIYGKTVNAGQACIAPDYVFAPRGVEEEFIQHAKEALRALYPSIANNPDYTSIINQKHHQRLNDWLEDAAKRGCRIEELHGDGVDDKSRRMSVHLALEPAADTMVMQHELFGPVMALRSYDNLDEALDFINARPRPLALYYFGKDRAEERRVLDNTCSGGVTVNDVMMHAGSSDLPFGGIGDSGMGNYHGIEGFRTFSHARAVLRQGFANPAKLFGLLPPYEEKADQMLQRQIKE